MYHVSNVDMFRTAPLKRFECSDAQDIDAIQGITSNVFVPHSLKFCHGGTAQRAASLRHVPLCNGGIMYLDYGVDVSVEVDAADVDYFSIQIPLRGSSVSHIDNREFTARPGQIIVVQPRQDFVTEWSPDCAKLLIKLEVEPFEQYLRSLLGRSSVQALSFDTDHTNSSSLEGPLIDNMLRTVQWIVNELDSPVSAASASSMLRREHQRTLMCMLLHCIPNNYSEELSEQEAPEAPHYIVQAERYIKENYKENLEMEELANLCRVSPRSLRDGFQRFRNVSPMRLLKLTRLDNVHIALKKANADDSVTSIALEHGFTELGKFSRDYKQRFGMLPSQTLCQYSVSQES